eukprot:tig00021603_g22822.t1
MHGRPRALDGGQRVRSVLSGSRRFVPADAEARLLWPATFESSMAPKLNHLAASRRTSASAQVPGSATAPPAARAGVCGDPRMHLDPILKPPVSSSAHCERHQWSWSSALYAGPGFVAGGLAGRGPDTSAAVGADIENGRLDETLAGFGSWCRPYSYKLGGVWQTYIRGIVPKAPLSLGESQPALEAIAIPVAQFKDPAPDVGPFLVKPHTKGKGKRTRNSAPAFLPPQPPATAPQQRPGQQRIDEMLPRQGTSASPASADGPSPVPGPGHVLSAIQGFGAQQEAERQALAARQAREAEARRQGRRAQRLQRTLAFRAELEAGFRADQIAGAEASERWRAFEAETAGLAKGLGYSYRRVPVPKDYASAAALEASRAEIDAAEDVLSEAHYTLGALAATLTWLLGGTPTASAVIGVGFGYAAKTLYAPGSVSMATAGMRPAGR